MRVGIHQPRNDARPLGVEQVAVEPDLRLELAVLPDPDHASRPRRQGAVTDSAERIVRPRHHGRELTGVAKGEVGADQVARSIPCWRANSTAIS